MEMSWWALLPTIVIASIIAGLALAGSGEPKNVDGPNGEDPAAPPDPLPTLGSWLRKARRPVWPIDYSELNTRVRRGFKLAGLMTIVPIAMVAADQPSRDLGLLLLIGTLLLGAIWIAIACIASVIHSLILQILPYRGLIVSTALGAAIGFVAALVMRTNSYLPNRALIWSGVIYGLVIGVIDFATPRSPKKHHQQQRLRTEHN